MTPSKVRRAVGVTCAAAALSTGALMAAASPAEAANVTIFIKLEVRHSGQVAEVWDWSQANQAAVNQWPWHGGPNQQWEKIFVTSTSTGPNTPDFILKNRNSGKCLDVEGGISTAPSTPLVQADCDNTASQRWYTHKMADKGLLSGKGYRYYFNRNSGMVIDVGYASHEAGARLYQYPAKPLYEADNQLWNEDFGGVG